MKTFNVVTLTALVALAAGAPATAAPINPSRPPTKAAPTFVPILSATPKTGEVTYAVSVALMVPVIETRIVVKDGKKVAEKVTGYRTELRTELRRMVVSAFNPMTAAGKPLAPDDLARRLIPGTVFLLAADGDLPEAAYLRLFKPDTVVLVAKKKP